VSGHRSERLAGADPELLATAVRHALQALAREAAAACAAAKEVYQPQPPALRLASSLAEGADRLVAREALALGYELICPLPFARAISEQESRDAASRAEYRALLAQAAAVFALDGRRDDPEQATEAYAAAMRVLLSQSDVLIAVWDGEPPRGAGGTADAVNLAIGLGIPVIWVRSQPPHQVSLLAIDRSGRRQEHELSALSEHVHTLLRPPRGPGSDSTEADGPDGLRDFLGEHQPRWTAIGWVWGSFAALAGDLRPRLPRLRAHPFLVTTERSWHRQQDRPPGLPASVTAQVERGLLAPYAWADGLAIYYADLYRSSFVLYYALGVVATLLALLIGAAGLAEHGGPLRLLLRLGAFLSVLLILVLWLTASHWRWQQRWIDYRLLAEALRQHRFLMLLGRALSFSRLPQRQGRRAEVSWAVWYFRAITRQAGLIDAELTPDSLEATRRLLHDALIEEDVRYHHANSSRLEHMETRLRHLGSALFVVALVALGALVLRENVWIDFVAALLPVTGGALAAVRSQAELSRVTARSRTMAEQLESLEREIRALSAPTSEQLARLAESAAQAMLGEVLDWQVVFLEKPLDLG
jgi:hypothetical protein